MLHLEFEMLSYYTLKLTISPVKNTKLRLSQPSVSPVSDEENKLGDV